MEANVTVKLPPQQFDLLANMAQLRKQTVSEVAETVLTQWLAREVELDKARQIMRELGEGLDSSSPGQAIARDHDLYLYGKLTR